MSEGSTRAPTRSGVDRQDRQGRVQIGETAGLKAAGDHRSRVSATNARSPGLPSTVGCARISARGRFITDQEVRPCPNHLPEARGLRANRQTPGLRPARPEPAEVTPPGTARPAPSRPPRRRCPRIRRTVPTHPGRRPRARPRRRPATSRCRRGSGRGRRPATSRDHRRATSRDRPPATNKDRPPATNKDRRRATSRARPPGTNKDRRRATSRARRRAVPRVNPATSRGRPRGTSSRPDIRRLAPTGRPEGNRRTPVRRVPIHRRVVRSRASTCPRSRSPGGVCSGRPCSP
jgi:hypothetical protein